MFENGHPATQHHHVGKRIKGSSILGRLRVIKVSPTKGKKQSRGVVNVPLPNEVVVMDYGSPSTTDAIEESLETMEWVLRKPSRFTFDLVPSVSESFGEDNSTSVAEPVNDRAESNNVYVVTHAINGLPMMDETPTQPRSPANDKVFQAATLGPTKLDHRTRTNSTSATSAFSSVDNLFCGSSGYVHSPNSDNNNDVVGVGTDNNEINEADVDEDVVIVRQANELSTSMSCYPATFNLWSILGGPTGTTTTTTTARDH